MIDCFASQCAYCRSSIASGQRWVREKIYDPALNSGDPSYTVPLWRIGNWDGTPTELLNGDKINHIHPSDVRISTWNPRTYVIGVSSPGVVPLPPSLLLGLGAVPTLALLRRRMRR